MSNNKAKIVTITLLMLLAACGSGGGGGDGNNQSPVTTPISAPAAPGDLSISVSGDSVSLSWSEVSEASSYKVYRDGSLLRTVSTNSFSENKLVYGSYLYEVTSVNDSGESASKASISVDVHEAAPAAPTDLSALVSEDSVSLSWSEGSGADSYKVYRDSSLLQSVSTNSFSDTKLDDADYLYEVASVNDYGESKASVSATVNNVPPEAPSNLSASVSGSTVSLTWDAVSDATSYKLYRNGSLIASPTTNSYTDTVSAEGTYSYEVSSVDDAGESTSKANVSVIVNLPPEAPTNFTASVNQDSVNLTWDEVSDATEGYKLYRNGSLIASPTTNSYTDTGLADATYSYEVSSVDDAGEGAKASTSATVNNVPPEAPTNLIASINVNSVHLNWDAVADATSYKVYRDGSHVTSPTTNSYTDTNLNDGTHSYEVSSVDDAGESTSKASASVSISVDPLYAYQWHLANTGQKAFATFSGNSGEDINHSGALALGITGARVRVNVIDTGLELLHPDLQANIVAGASYNYLDGGTDPTNNIDTSGDHGTSVAGLIAAVGNNGIGVAGVAGDALLQGYNFLAGEQADGDYTLAHGLDTKLENTDIFNKSLGATYTADAPIDSDLLDTLSCLTTGGSFDMSLDGSCESALRSGSGAIYVKSAGNSFATSNGDQICDALELTCWNANMEPEQTYPYQIVVGALNAKGEKSSYSTAGSSIWISAPGGEYGLEQDYIDEQLGPYDLGHEDSGFSDAAWQPAMITTDQVSCNSGYTTRTLNISGIDVGRTSFHSDSNLNSNCEYTSTFNGTSSAAPVVSGVVALMLEANQNLSWRDVKHILAQTARQVDSNAAALDVPAIVCADSDCSSSEASSSISLTARDAWITNATGYSYHNWYGFGAVNAGAAVAMAQNYSSSLGTWQKDSYELELSPSLNIPDATGAAATTSLTVVDNLTIETVQLELSITHNYIADLAVVLYSPEGTRSVLLTPYNEYYDGDFTSTLLSNAFYGENAAGDWQVEIYDIWETVSGTLNSVSLNIYGHSVTGQSFNSIQTQP